MFVIVLMDTEQNRLVRAIPVGYSEMDEALAHANILAARARKTRSKYDYRVRAIENMKSVRAAAPNLPS